MTDQELYIHYTKICDIKFEDIISRLPDDTSIEKACEYYALSVDKFVQVMIFKTPK